MASHRGYPHHRFRQTRDPSRHRHPRRDVGAPLRDPGDGAQANPPEDAQTSQEVLVFRTGFDALRMWIIYDPDDALMAWQTTIPKGPVKLPEIQCGVYCGRNLQNGYLCAFWAGKPPNKSCDDALWLSFKVSAGPGSGSTGSGSPRRTCVINPLFVLTVRPVSSAARPLCRLTWMQRFLRVTLSGPLSGPAPCTSSYGCQTPRQPTREHKGRRPVSESED